ncbi:MAG TPA: T9SS type A sorting domain-containing protein, partial [Bacteroidia bacterium]
NGSATASASGGTAAYSYAWSNGQVTATATGLAVNTYTVVVTDANGCSITKTANIINSGAPTLSVTTTNAGCGASNGTATAHPSGGTGSITYAWSNGQATATATGLAANTYTVTITDAGGCSATSVATVVNPNGPSVVTTPTNATSCSASDGSVTSSVSGGTAPYAYAWSSGQVSSAISGVAAGNYTLTVTDQAGCKQTSIATVSCTTTSTLDAGVNAVGNPNGSMCTSTISPIVNIKNFGSPTLTSCTINYYVDAPPASTFNWNGSLASGAAVNVALPSISGIAMGAHTFYSSTSNPNGSTDANTSNDQKQSTFNVTNTTSAIPIVEGFESSTSLPTGWTLVNPDNDAAWQVVSTVSNGGTNSIGFDNCDGNGAGVSMAGTKDRFITSAYDFTSATATARMTFDVAYALLNYKNQTYPDTLAIYASNDCGTTWNQIYLKGGSTLANSVTPLTCWQPTASDWRNDVVSLGSYAGQGSVMFAFENRSGWGEWIYIDNINIEAITAVETINPLSGFNIYPNPAATSFTLDGVSKAERIRYSIYNVVGAEIKVGNVATSGGSFNGKIFVNDIPRGMYFIKVSDGKNEWTKKLNVQ